MRDSGEILKPPVFYLLANHFAVMQARFESQHSLTNKEQEHRQSVDINAIQGGHALGLAEVRVRLEQA